MKTFVAIISALAVVAASHGVFCAQDSTRQKKTDLGHVEGTWTEVLREHAGKPEYTPMGFRKGAKPENAAIERLWKITKDKIQKGSDDKSFPSEAWRVTLDPDGKTGAIDGVLLDKQGKDRPEHKWLGIYAVKNDILLVCVNLDDPPMRPEKFTTSPRASGTFLFLLRRSKPKK